MLWGVYVRLNDSCLKTFGVTLIVLSNNALSFVFGTALQGFVHPSCGRRLGDPISLT